MEAALLIPVLLLMFLLLAEPAILLYNRIVMTNAAAEACRLIATKPGADALTGYEAYVIRRLGAVPPVDIFHVHSGDASCTWDIELSGSDGSTEVSVSIENRLKPLPLVSYGAAFAGLLDADGCLSQRVCVTAPAQAAWALESGSPGEWVTQWSGVGDGHDE